MKTAFFRQLVEHLPDAFIVTTRHGLVTYWSEGARALFAYTSDEALGQSLHTLIHVRDAGSAESPRHNHGGLPTVLCKRKDGVLIYASCTVSEVDLGDGTSSGLLHSYADVTHTQVRFQSSLVSARYRDLLESMPDAVVIVNASGSVLFLNTQAEGMFGYDGAELIGQPIELLMPVPLRGSHVHHRLAYFDQPRTRAMGAGLDLLARKKSGDEFPVEISLSPLHTEFGVMGMSAIRDVSDRRRIEQMLKDKNVELERANLAKDRFLATMSHELRTPLNAILGYTSLLLMQMPGPLTTEQAKQLNAVKRSGTHLLALINDLLDLAMVDAGNVMLSLELTVWQREIIDIVETLRQTALEKGLSLLLALPVDEVVSRMDRKLLRQLLINLVSNAIKYTRRGEVCVSLQVEAGASGKELHLGVQDTGIGMVESDLAKLFKPFSRVGPEEGRPEGTGLGLHLSKRLMGLLCGRIEVSSELGVGSRFTLIFPELGVAGEQASSDH